MNFLQVYIKQETDMNSMWESETAPRERPVQTEADYHGLAQGKCSCPSYWHFPHPPMTNNSLSTPRENISHVKEETQRVTEWRREREQDK